MAIYFRTLRENVVEAIRDKIINQELKPGERIVEMELAEEFKTSRGPVREALRQLEHEGLIEYTGMWAVPLRIRISRSLLRST